MSGSSYDPTDPNSIDLDGEDTQQGGLARAFTEAGVDPEDDDAEPPNPVYKVMPDSRIPVSSKRGSLWKSRRDIGRRALGDMCDAWDEAVRYYNHDQAEHRDGSQTGYSGNRYLARRLNERNTSTENLVFANVSSQVPELYAKNPIVSITSQPGDSTDPNYRPDGEVFARGGEKLINALFGMKGAPGVNLKPKAKRNVLIALLMNRAWFEVGYTQKDQSSEAALANIQFLSDKLKSADDVDDIRETEAELFALEERIEFLQPSGPFVRIRMPSQVLVDPDCNDPYGCDANWMLVEDMLPTDYINAVYGQRDKDNSDTVRSIFEPTHILSGGSSADSETDMGTNSFSLFNKEQPYKSYGFTDESSFDKAKRTRIWWAWDKVTRRLEMYADNDWKWPIWVWDDPYGLQNFFPLTPMWFHDNPVSTYAKGEVSYYLDQQDQINEINDEKRRSLYWARRNIFFDPDSGVTQDMANRILEGPKPTATPLKVPDGKKPEDMLFAITPPSTNFASLFDKKDLYAAIDRIAATSEAQRGGEFKTNTTNKAIDYYSTMGNMRMDMRLDAIEDCIADIGWKMLQLCLKFMDAATVQSLVGIDVSSVWHPLDPLGDLNRWSVQCVGGSTQKLSSQAKKHDAVEIGQILSQYVKAAPATVLKTSLRMFSEAFDGFTVTKEDWEQIDAEVEKTLLAGQGGAPGQQPMAPGAPPGDPNAGATPAGAPPGGPLQLAVMVTKALEQLPPQVLQAIGVALAQGAPPQAILAQMMQASAQGGGVSGPTNGAAPPAAPPTAPMGAKLQ
jgi:hypothetical protein